MEFGALYEFSRTATGWGCEALDPPASSIRAASSIPPARTSADRCGSCRFRCRGEEVELVERYDGWTLAIREPAGSGKGRFTLLGPVVAAGARTQRAEYTGTEPMAQFSVAGGSADLTGVLLSVRGAHEISGQETRRSKITNSLLRNRCMSIVVGGVNRCWWVCVTVVRLRGLRT